MVPMENLILLISTLESTHSFSPQKFNPGPSPKSICPKFVMADVKSMESKIKVFKIVGDHAIHVLIPLYKAYMKEHCLDESSATAPSMAKPGCEQDHCGDILIPYPFGMGKSCYKDEWFSVSCSHSFDPPKPILTKLMTSSSWQSKDLRGSPFLYSLHNDLVGVGCHNVLLRDRNEEIMAGCTSTCDKSINTKGCLYGINCCLTRLQEDLDFYSLSTTASYSERGDCTYAFLAYNYTTMFRTLLPLLEMRNLPHYSYPGLSQNKSTLTTASMTQSILHGEIIPIIVVTVTGLKKGTLISHMDVKLEKATDNFNKNRILGQGGQGTVYKGTFGYLDPEYFQSSQFTEKSDVYSFGVVLAELLTGQKPISSTRSPEEKSLATHFILSLQESRLFDIIDARVVKEGRKEDIMTFAKLAGRCLNLNGRKRPTMKEVTTEIDNIRVSALHLNVDQNFQENACVVTEITEFLDMDDTSTSRGSCLDDTKESSFDVQPLLFNTL
ncbi:Wall-associated receptor kinase-like 9 [Vitis vinifera]|uniref:Wall-associated receptor kinase-like 9 n=1 Tax=Vitis vinifera TaxID=29760 RepID=A0A438C1T4_VITVI|nr:Wall-associated receptor kinase-like 9 [Vitis vinifera]